MKIKVNKRIPTYPNIHIDESMPYKIGKDHCELVLALHDRSHRRLFSSFQEINKIISETQDGKNFIYELDVEPCYVQKYLLENSKEIGCEIYVKDFYYWTKYFIIDACHRPSRASVMKAYYKTRFNIIGKVI